MVVRDHVRMILQRCKYQHYTVQAYRYVSYNKCVYLPHVVAMCGGWARCVRSAALGFARCMGPQREASVDHELLTSCYLCCSAERRDAGCRVCSSN